MIKSEFMYLFRLFVYNLQDVIIPHQHVYLCHLISNRNKNLFFRGKKKKNMNTEWVFFIISQKDAAHSVWGAWSSSTAPKLPFRWIMFVWSASVSAVMKHFNW